MYVLQIICSGVPSWITSPFFMNRYLSTLFLKPPLQHFEGRAFLLRMQTRYGVYLEMLGHKTNISKSGHLGVRRPYLRGIMSVRLSPGRFTHILPILFNHNNTICVSAAHASRKVAYVCTQVYKTIRTGNTSKSLIHAF